MSYWLPTSRAHIQTTHSIIFNQIESNLFVSAKLATGLGYKKKTSSAFLNLNLIISCVKGVRRLWSIAPSADSDCMVAITLDTVTLALNLGCKLTVKIMVLIHCLKNPSTFTVE